MATKEWSTRDSDYCPGDTVKRTWSKSQVSKTLRKYTSAVTNCVLENHNASAKEGPQGARREQELSGTNADPIEVADKIDDWSKVRAYVTEVKPNGTQEVSVHLYSGYNTRYRYRFAVNADEVCWEV